MNRHMLRTAVCQQRCPDLQLWKIAKIALVINGAVVCTCIASHLHVTPVHYLLKVAFDRHR